MQLAEQARPSGANAVHLLEFSSKQRTPIIRQTELAECGLACLAMIAAYHGHSLSLPAIRQKYSSSLKGLNLRSIIKMSDRLGFASRALSCPLEELNKASLPCILHWDLNHFVVLTKLKNKNCTVHDPALGKRVYTHTELSKHYTGVLLELRPTNKFQQKCAAPRMRLSQLWGSLSGLKSSLVSLLALSMILQILALASPYYMQWVVDEVLVSRDQPLLVVLALGFAMLNLISVVATSIRSWLILRLSALLNMQMGINLLHHLLRLPLKYFEARHVGDIVSRFASMGDIRERITTGFVETVVDGVMSLAVLTMMFFYSSTLTVVVLLFLTLYLLLRLAFYPPLHRATEDSIRFNAKEQSNFLENVRGIQTIKLLGTEVQRQSIWQNRYADVINSGIRLGKLSIGYQALNKALFGFENVLVIYLAAHAAMNAQLSIGMVLAFIAYKGQLTERIINLVEQAIQFRMMRIHLERISDIALHPQEANRSGSGSNTEVRGEICLRNISFSYDKESGQERGRGRHKLLDNISLEVAAGECIAITGTSGCGKSTLLKIILGLLEPDSGQILLDGQDIRQIGLKSYREHVAAVLQNDCLLAGTIGDNISFFDPEPSLERMQQCAQLAAIHNDIVSMTMSYNSLVGDMGSSLSGGQAQRLLLARALYKQPKVLVMDEATSHLDMANEATIAEQIHKLSISRIIVAHRTETVKHANRVFCLSNGTLSVVEP